MRGTRDCSSDLLLGFPAAGQPHRGRAYGCQRGGHGSRQILTLFPQWLAHLGGSYGERRRTQGGVWLFLSDPRSFFQCTVTEHSLNARHYSRQWQSVAGGVQSQSCSGLKRTSTPTLVTWGCVERELGNCQAVKQPIQHCPLRSQQAGVKGFGDGPAVPIHGFTQNSKALRETRAGLTTLGQ